MSRQTAIRFFGATWITVAIWLLNSAIAAAHPLVENSFDVVASREQIVVERIASEEIAIVDNGGNGPSANPRWQAAMEQHADYVRRHVHIVADGHEIEGRAELAAAGDICPRQDAASAGPPGDDSESGPLIRYRLTYPLAAPPARDRDSARLTPRVLGLGLCRAWSACGRANSPSLGCRFWSANEKATLRCDWTANRSAAAKTAIRTDVPFWPTFRAYAAHGIEHILTGYDHLLFVTALALAAGRLWDLVKIVTAFTIAHTLTLGLSVFNIVTLRSSIVEPMIAPSIVFVAVQNVFWPERSTGRVRLAIAFGFGLIKVRIRWRAERRHERNAERRDVGLVWRGLQLGVEIGHQLVVLPLYSLLAFARLRERDAARHAFSPKSCASARWRL